MATLATLPADLEVILTEFSLALDAAGVDVPDRQYLNPGALIAWDEPQLTIGVIRIGMGQPGESVGSSLLASQFNFSVTFGLLLIVEVPALVDAGLPSTPDLDAAGQALIGLSTTLWTTAIALRAAGKLAPGNAGVALGPLAPVGPSGALAGVSLQIEMSLV
jgi:hypothetical protein